MPKNPQKPSRESDLAFLVDKLGVLKAQIAELCEQERIIKEKLIDTRLPSIDGELFRVSISVHERISLDTEIARTFLVPSELMQCMRVSEAITVRVQR